jgi:hypothetical protein
MQALTYILNPTPYNTLHPTPCVTLRHPAPYTLHPTPHILHLNGAGQRLEQVADIVHRAVKDNSGAPNKNIGDAFLVAWKLPDDAVLGLPLFSSLL